jgi:hypothetical protein
MFILERGIMVHPQNAHVMAHIELNGKVVNK